MINIQAQNRKFDLEDRTLKFSKDCIDLCKFLGKDAINIVLVDQLMRSSSSIGANYREANDSTSKKDFYHRIGISRREAKESKYWLDLLMHSNPGLSGRMLPLADEALQLTKILSTIVNGRDK